MTDQDPKGGSVQFETPYIATNLTAGRRCELLRPDVPTISPISGTVADLKPLLDATSVTT